MQCLPDAKFILSVDCDDALDPDYVRKLVDVLHDDESLVLAHGTLKLFGVPIYHYRQHSASIMSSHTGDRVLEMHRRLLEFHSKGIARTGGLTAFVNRLLMPSLREGLRSGDWKRSAPLLKTLLTTAPWQMAAALGAHYGRRLRSRLGFKP